MGLQVRTEPLPKSQVGIEINVGKEECHAAWESVVRELQKKSDIEGFRKGRAPRQIVINRFGRDRIRASACEEVIEKSIQKALEDSGINAIGQAQVDGEGGVQAVVDSYDPDSNLTFKIRIDVWPDCTFTSPYQNLDVEAEDVQFDESLVGKALEELRKKESFSVLSAEGSKASMGKLLVADLVGYYREEDGSKGDRLPDIADGQSIEVPMEVGKFMPGFVEGLVGAAVGETRSVAVEFPKQNPRPELAGLKAVFDVTVHAIKDVVLPELNDDFAKQVSESDTLDALRNTIRDRLGVESESNRAANVNKAIEDRLASIVEVALPESLVENQVKNKFASMLSSFKDKGMPDEQVKAMVTKENYELYKERARGNVEKNLRVNFAVSKIAKEHNLVPDPQEVDDQLALVKAELKGQEFEEEKAKDQVEAQLERELVLKLLKTTAKVSMKPPKQEDTEKSE